MKKKTILTIIAALTITISSVCLFVGCGNYNGPDGFVDPPYGYIGPGNDPSAGKVGDVIENQVISTDSQNDLYLSLDPHIANYNIMKNMIKDGASINDIRSVVKIDHILNSFNYGLSQPQDGELLAMQASIFDCPYNEDKKLLSIGLKAKEVKLESVANNIVMLLDVSGSMSATDKIDLMKDAMIMMAENLNENDTLSIVTYSNKTRVVLDGAKIGDNLNKIKRTIGDLRADGGTNGSGGIQKAYEIANKHFIQDGNNRVILATDGDFNIGISDNGKLKEFISEKRDSGVYLTCVGLGNFGDYSTATMEALARFGNGYWGFIRNIDDARKMLVEELQSSIVAVAKDVKAKILFSKDNVKNFRLLGFEQSILSEMDYEEQDTDAAELGSDFEMMLCFEIQLQEGVELSAADIVQIAQIDLRYKEPSQSSDDESKELTLPICSDVYNSIPSQNDKFVSSAIEFSLVALNSKYKAQANLDSALERLESLSIEDKYKIEFIELVKTYKELLSDIPIK